MTLTAAVARSSPALALFGAFSRPVMPVNTAIPRRMPAKTLKTRMMGETTASPTNCAVPVTLVTVCWDDSMTGFTLVLMRSFTVFTRFLTERPINSAISMTTTSVAMLVMPQMMMTTSRQSHFAPLGRHCGRIVHGCLLPQSRARSRCQLASGPVQAPGFPPVSRREAEPSNDNRAHALDDGDHHNAKYGCPIRQPAAANNRRTSRRCEPDSPAGRGLTPARPRCGRASSSPQTPRSTPPDRGAAPPGRVSCRYAEPGHAADIAASA